MPNIPIPQQVPIQRAGWSTDFSGNVQMPSNERTPVNPIMSGLSQAGMQAQQALQGAQTANAVTDVQQKQRKMQLSMLNGLANLPPDQYAKLAPNVIAIANRYNPSYQIKPDLDQSSAKMLMMSNVPTEQMPMFDLMMGQSDLVNNLTNGGAGSGIIPNVTNVMPTGGGGFAAINVPIGQPRGATSIPPAEGGAQPIASANDLEGVPTPTEIPPLATDALMTNPGLAVMKPQSLTAANEAKKTELAMPAGQQAIETAKGIGGEIAKQKGASLTAEAMYNKLYQNLEAMRRLNDITPDSVTASPDTKAFLGKRYPQDAGAIASLMGVQGVTPEGSGALANWDQLNHAGILNGLQQLIAMSQAGSAIRSNKTIVKLLESGQGIPADLPQSQRTKLIDTLEAELKNTQIASENVGRGLTGASSVPYKSIPTAADQANAAMQPKPKNTAPLINTKAAYEALPSGTIYMESDGKKYRKP